MDESELSRVKREPCHLSSSYIGSQRNCVQNRFRTICESSMFRMLLILHCDIPTLWRMFYSLIPHKPSTHSHNNFLENRTPRASTNVFPALLDQHEQCSSRMPSIGSAVGCITYQCAMCSYDFIVTYISGNRLTCFVSLKFSPTLPLATEILKLQWGVKKVF